MSILSLYEHFISLTVVASEHICSQALQQLQAQLSTFVLSNIYALGVAFA